jgi:putative Mg2+ transporter-C (MgtC) family protein
MMVTSHEVLVKLGLAVFVGGLIGLEREFQYKAAGFRTIILITIGSTLYTLFSISIAGETDSTMRIASNIVTGIGFLLGAGTILREGGRIGGLTTAATIQLAAALGMGIAAGEAGIVLWASFATLVIMLVFPRVVRGIDRIRDARTYKIQISEGSILSTWRTTGSPQNQELFVQRMLANQVVVRLEN